VAGLTFDQSPDAREVEAAFALGEEEAIVTDAVSVMP
jgi:hypothetical protein